MNLTLAEQAILILYKYFFNNDYTPDEPQNIKIQAAFYLCISCTGLRSVPLYCDYGFMLEENGPQSPALKATLEALKKKETQIKNFYDNLGPQPLELLWDEEQRKKLIALQFFIQYNNNKDFASVLSCLQYIRGSWCIDEFEDAHLALKKRLPKYSSSTRLLRKAWKCLLSMDDIINNQDYDKFNGLKRMRKPRITKEN